jgi:hypothetical protein
MEDQRLAALLADPPLRAGPAHQLRCDGGIFAFGNIPGHVITAPVVDHQVEVPSQPRTVVEG